MWWWTLGLALAGPPSAEVVGDEIVAQVSVATPVDQTRARVTDPAWITRVEGGGSETRVVGQDGDCQLIETMSPSVFLAVTYTTRQCPTEDGARASLVTSNTFERYATSWRVVPEGAGSRIEYRLTMVTRLSMPQSWINNTGRKRIEALMKNIQGELGAPAPASP